ncbi:unnamed protein product [Amaranthus hypochondriacus]
MANSCSLLQLEMFIVTGDTEKLNIELHILKSKDRNLTDLIWKSDNSTILHIAARAGQTDVMSVINTHDHRLFFCRNDNNDLPIHVALKAGQENAVRKLIEIQETNEQLRSNSIKQYEMVNNNRNTALHIALQNRFKDLAELLLEKNSNICYYLNEKQMSPLYMAIKGEYFELAKKMLQISNHDENSDLRNRRHSCVHVAIMARNKDILKTLISKFPKFKDSIDEKGRTILSYAAQIGYFDGVKYLIENYPDLAYQNDEDGSYPIHKACSSGNIEVVKELYSRLPNNKDQNLLHIAAQSGQHHIVKYLLGREENGMKELINIKDCDGNTPLHLATLGKHSRVVYALTTNETVDLKALNNQQLTALDLAEKNYKEEPTLDERLTWTALIYANVPRSVPLGTENLNRTQKIKYTDRFHTLLVVCSLIATVTFAASFTIPGGYSSSNKNEGMATLAHKFAFQVFVISNTISMFSSMFSAIVLIWAHLDDIELSLLALNLSLPFLCIALSMMSVAFMAGLFVVLYNMCNGLAIMVLVMGTIFLIAILAFLIPLYSPKSHINNKYVRCIFRFFFKLTLCACSRSPTN